MARTDKRRAACDPLRQGAEPAVGCAAQRPRTREEFPATGTRPRHVEALTPSERRVAMPAAEGRTDREIAQEHYVTEKRVENHLARADDKLGVRSRTGADHTDSHRSATIPTLRGALDGPLLRNRVEQSLAQFAG